MTVTSIEPYTKTKFRVFLDGRFAGVLYKGELTRLGLQEGKEISEDICQKIRNEIILKRARLRAMHLLADMDRTESGLREKLRGSLYPEDVIEEAVAYVRSFGYLNDSRFAEHFVLSRKGMKSKAEIRAALVQKGVAEEDMEKALGVYDEEDTEREAVRRILEKKKFDPDTCDEVQIRKMYGYLSRRGFRYDTIRQVIQNHNQDA